MVVFCYKAIHVDRDKSKDNKQEGSCPVQFEPLTVNITQEWQEAYMSPSICQSLDIKLQRRQIELEQTSSFEVHG